MFEPADLVTALAASSGGILPWVGAGVAGGLALLFVFMAIRAGLGFFRSLADERWHASEAGRIEQAQYDREVAEFEANRAGDDAFFFGDDGGPNMADLRDDEIDRISKNF